MGATGLEILVLLLITSAMPATESEPLPVDQVLAGMPADCELMGFVDLRGALPNVDALLTTYATQPWVTGNADIAEGVDELGQMLHTAVAEIATETGIDVASVAGISGCMRMTMSPAGDPVPEFLMLIGGPPSSVVPGLASLLEMAPMGVSSGGVAIYGDDFDISVRMASPGDGILLIGTETLVTERLEGAGWDTWSTAPSDGLTGRLAELVPAGARGYFGFQPGELMSTLIASEMDTDGVAVIEGLDRIITVWNGASLHFEVTTQNDDSFAVANLMLMAMHEAAQGQAHLFRALLYGALAILSPADMELDEPLRLMAQHRDAVIAYTESLGLLTDGESLLVSDPVGHTVMLDASNGMTQIVILMSLGAASFLALGDVSEPAPYMLPAVEHVAPPEY